MFTIIFSLFYSIRQGLRTPSAPPRPIHSNILALVPTRIPGRPGAVSIIRKLRVTPRQAEVTFRQVVQIPS